MTRGVTRSEGSHHRRQNKIDRHVANQVNNKYNRADSPTVLANSGLQAVTLNVCHDQFDFHHSGSPPLAIIQKIGHCPAMTTASADERLTNLEIRITHQDEVIEQLNEVIYSHQKQIDLIEKKLKDIEKQGGDPAGPTNEKPPHY